MISLNKQGENVYRKSRHPVQYGRYSEVDTPRAVFRFNLNHEITAMRGKDVFWPSEQEWLKRTAGNDWVYYSTGGYSGTYETFGKDALADPIQFKIPSPYNEVYKATGEYYVPNLPYHSNSILGIDPFRETSVTSLIDSWYTILSEYLQSLHHMVAAQRNFAGKVLSRTPENLQRRAEALFRIIGSRPTVLPPGSRHVDYNVIPISVAEGCRYKCGFCTVKNSRPFRTRSRSEIKTQIDQLMEHYGHDLVNYNALFLGDHDALNADQATLIWTINKAIGDLNLRSAYMQGCALFLFGGVDSFLEKDAAFFRALDQLNCRVYINLGLESADQATLDYLQKPIFAAQVEESFRRMLELNDHYMNIEITANFVMGSHLHQNHYSSFLELVRNSLSTPRSKGTIYLSPLFDHAVSRSLLFEFNQLKRFSRLPTYLYTIQRL